MLLHTSQLKETVSFNVKSIIKSKKKLFYLLSKSLVKGKISQCFLSDPLNGNSKKRRENQTSEERVY